ncbi:hypothetical protein niasHT_033351 [Heterodera trifolii]|uniref:Uncharacterized protein n=1 Tax=Heterodera trifolii TaxID=157864 RepID=A0ABD2I4S3_9BILA
MVTPNGGGGRRRRIRHLWLSMFLLLLVIATTAALLGLLTPSWQVVYLEDGRTEHHHGLWLDCKRDFSYDYGRPREYYETLHRRFDLAGPFDQFWLPPLLCVFKFDYWLDDEDWYEFGYDENRLWGDAYQHLFLGWKIAALVAHLTAAICSFVSILFIICAYCHRLCTCVAAVLVTLAVLSQLGGNVIFYAFASNQNTNIIKEEDGIYEQHFGWSFWMSIMANCLMLLTSFTGCLTTKVVLGKTRTKLIKIQTDDFGDDSTQLLRLSAASSTYVPHQQHRNQNGGPPPMQFRRSPPAGRKSAIYKIESNDLKRWERERMRTVEKGSQFKRTNSMPMIRRQLSDHQLHNASSISDLSNPGIMVVGGPSQTPFCPIRGTANGPCYAPAATPADVIYEYVDQGSLSLASTLKAGDFLRSRSKFNVYDPVPPMSNGQQQHRQQQPQHRRVESTSIGTQQIADNHHQQQQQRREIYGDNEYLQPKSLTSNESDDNNLASSSTVRPQKALIVPVDVGTFRAISRECPVVPTTTTTSSSLSSPPSMASAYEHVMPQIPLNTFPNQTPPQRQWEAEILAELKQRQQQQKQQQQHRQNLIDNHLHSSSQRRLCPPILSEVPSPLSSTVAPQSLGTTTVSRDSYRIQINTFQSMADRQQQQQPYHITPINNRYSRSITDLVPLGHNGTALPVRAFERGQADSPERSTISTTLSTVQGENSPPTFLGGAEVPPPMGTSLLRQRLGSASVALRGSADWRRGTLQSEAERSLGSSRAATTFLGSPPEATTDFGQTVTKTFGQNGGMDNVEQSVDQPFGRRKFFGQNDMSPGTDV